MSSLKAQLVIEIMGRPPEHIKEALNTVVVKLGSEKGVRLIDKKYFDPKPLEKVPNLYSTFAHVDAEFESVNHFFAILMGYMPSNVEVYEPEKFKMQANDINSLANFITNKLHRYDEIAKKAMFERDNLYRQIQVMQGKKVDVLGSVSQKTQEKPTIKSSKKAKKTKASSKKK